ncbi:DNA repair protein RecO [Thiolapillus sp.]
MPNKLDDPVLSDELTPAYVLHSRKYGEHHLLVDMFTCSAGRIPLMARGGAAAKSTRRGMLQPFSPLLITWSGRGRIANLKQVENRSCYVLPRGKALFSGFYLNELLIRLVDQYEPMPELFRSYEKTIESLGDGLALDLPLRCFELELLQTLGYGVDLLHEGQSGVAVSAQACYHYESETGLRRVPQEAGFLAQGDTLMALARQQALDVRQSREARELMRHILGFYLGDRPLKSREFFYTPG